MKKRIRPISRVVKIEAEIDKIVGEVFFHKRRIPYLTETWVPWVDISETRNDINVQIELPGVEREEITILLSSSRVEIKGVKHENLRQNRVKYLRLERAYGFFQRYIILPSPIVPEKAKALLENGILTLTLKKYRKNAQKKVVLEIRNKDE